VPVRIVRQQQRSAPAIGFWRRALITLTLAGALVAIAGPSTLASFNATTSTSTAVNTGVLVLDNTQQSGAECVSAGSGPSPVTIPAANTATGCTQFAVSGATAMPGQAIGPFSTTVKNVGNLDATSLKLYANSTCTDSATGGMPYNGGGNLCSQMQMYIQRYSDSGFTTPSSCVYGAASGASCTGFDSSHTMANFASSNTSATPIALGSLTSGSSAYFKLFLSFPSSSNDTFQGRTADIVLVWFLQQ
jgi:hypothetical protein